MNILVIYQGSSVASSSMPELSVQAGLVESDGTHMIFQLEVSEQPLYFIFLFFILVCCFVLFLGLFLLLTLHGYAPCARQLVQHCAMGAICSLEDRFVSCSTCLDRIKYASRFMP